MRDNPDKAIEALKVFGEESTQNGFDWPNEFRQDMVKLYRKIERIKDKAK